MPAAIAAEEVRRRGTAANELDVDVSRLAHDVAEEPSVAIDVVEGPSRRSSSTDVPGGASRSSSRVDSRA